MQFVTISLVYRQANYGPVDHVKLQFRHHRQQAGYNLFANLPDAYIGNRQANFMAYSYQAKHLPDIKNRQKQISKTGLSILSHADLPDATST